MAVFYVLIGEVSVGNAIVIESRADPAFILRAGPGVDVADARDGERVRLDGGSGGHGPGGEAEVLELRVEAGAVGVGNDEGAGAELVARQFEILLGGEHGDILFLRLEEQTSEIQSL